MFVITADQATAIAKAVGKDVQFSLHRGRVYLTFRPSFIRPELTKRLWNAPEGVHFPSWSAPWGGTVSSVFDMLARAVQGKPVVPLSAWRYWVDGPAKLCSGRGGEVLAAVIVTGWPDSVPCILCGKQIKSVGDWWTIGEKGHRVSGPGCSMSDCRKVPA